MAFSPYQFQRSTSTASETLGNAGAGNPVRNGTGMVRSAFRPSDDACNYQLFVPGNMMYSTALERVAEGIVARIEGQVEKSARLKRMREMAQGIKRGVEKFGRAEHWRYGRVYAYEVDGFGSHSMMVCRLSSRLVSSLGTNQIRSKKDRIMMANLFFSLDRTMLISPACLVRRCLGTSIGTIRYIRTRDGLY